MLGSVGGVMENPGRDRIQENENLPEPWLRGTHTDLPAVARGVLHALELAREDVHLRCETLADELMGMQVLGLPSLAFQLRHMAGSLDRLLTYAEGGELTAEQVANGRSELHAGGSRVELLEEFDKSLVSSAARVQNLAGRDLEAARLVGRLKLPSILGGLLVHVAEHTQRHVGQLVTTAKVLHVLRASSGGLSLP
jgi:DinB superfamily